jgi:hypothetical protein
MAVGGRADSGGLSQRSWRCHDAIRIRANPHMRDALGRLAQLAIEVLQEVEHPGGEE